MPDVVTPDAPAMAGQPRKAEPPSASRIARQARRRKLRYALFGLGAIVLVAGDVAYWLSTGRYVETDDAYVQGNVLDVSTDVCGLVNRILVHEGEHVQQDQELFRLDPTLFQLAVDHPRRLSDRAL